MTIRKKTSPENISAAAEDDYYVVQKKKIAEEAQKAHRIHEEDIHLHLVANIPYYEDAPEKVRRALVQLNNLLLHRFDKPGMIYWDFFKKTPTELRDYASDFGADLREEDQALIIGYLEEKKQEQETLVDIGFDEDGEEDEVVFAEEKDEESEEVEEKEAD